VSRQLAERRMDDAGISATMPDKALAIAPQTGARVQTWTSRSALEEVS